MQRKLRIDHRRAKKEFERLLHDNIELRKFHEKVTETIEVAFHYEDVKYDAISII